MPSVLWNDNFSNGTAITVEYWFKGTNLNSPYRAQDASGNYFVPGYVNGSNIFHIISSDGGNGGGVLIGASFAINNNQWHHVAMTWQENGSFISYLDGAVVAQRAAATNAVLPAINATNYFGAKNGNDQFLSGTLDEMRIWNVVRTAQQIRENMHRTLSGSEPGVVGYWQFNERSGSTSTYNLAAGDYTGTLVNFAFGSGYGQVTSTAPLGMGTSSDTTNFEAGTANLGTVSVSTSFANPVELTVTEIAALPDSLPASASLDSCYWIITPYGTPGTFSANLTFTVPSWFTGNGAESPAAYTLYHRADNSDGSWTVVVPGATNVTSTTIEFDGITSFSQFMIGSSATDFSLPVQATDFSASAGVGSVTLSWKTQSEVDNAGFNVFRGDAGASSFDLIASYSTDNALKGLGTSSTGQSYQFVDDKVKSGATYNYKIQSVSTGGKIKDVSTITGITVDVPMNYALYQNYPNPFNPSTTIRFDLKQSSTVTLEIYNVLGQRVMEQNYGMMNVGRYNEVISTDRFASGVYYYHIDVVGNDGQQFVSVKKLVLMK